MNWLLFIQSKQLPEQNPTKWPFASGKAAKSKFEESSIVGVLLLVISVDSECDFEFFNSKFFLETIIPKSCKKLERLCLTITSTSIYNTFYYNFDFFLIL